METITNTFKVPCGFTRAVGEHERYNQDCPICKYDSEKCLEELKKDPETKYFLLAFGNTVVVFHPFKFSEPKDQISIRQACGMILKSRGHLKYDSECFLCKQFGNIVNPENNDNFNFM